MTGRDATLWLVGLVWLGGITAGFVAWERYETTAGATGPVLATAEERAPGRWRLSVFAHPHCPCTRAMLGELAEALHATPDLTGRVVFVRPAGAADGWERGRLWDAAAAIPGVEVGCDGGTEARRFGAETSGQAVLTDPSGRVVFRGGLTRARGRAGESPGRRAVLDWVNSGTGPMEVPVFGCPLFGTDQR